MSKPAPISNMKETANWLTTSARCARRRPMPPVARPPAPDDIDRTGSVINVSRGAQANNIAAPNEIASVNARTHPSRPISPVRV